MVPKLNWQIYCMHNLHVVCTFSDDINAFKLRSLVDFK